MKIAIPLLAWRALCFALHILEAPDAPTASAVVSVQTESTWGGQFITAAQYRSLSDQ